MAVLLPTSVTPSHYQLELDVNLPAFCFNGNVTVTCTVNEATQTIQLHARELKIKTATFTADNNDSGNEGGGSSVSLTATNVTYNLGDHELCYVAKLSFPRNIEPGTGTLHIEFSGVLNDDMAGFSRSSYQSAAGTNSFRHLFA